MTKTRKTQSPVQNTVKKTAAKKSAAKKATAKKNSAKKADKTAHTGSTAQKPDMMPDMAAFAALWQKKWAEMLQEKGWPEQFNSAQFNPAQFDPAQFSPEQFFSAQTGHQMPPMGQMPFMMPFMAPLNAMPNMGMPNMGFPNMGTTQPDLGQMAVLMQLQQSIMQLEMRIAALEQELLKQGLGKKKSAKKTPKNFKANKGA